MKYANLIWQNTELSSSIAQVNIGDTMQFISIDELYRYMGIDLGEIVNLSLKELKEYRGEKLVLPFNWNLFDVNYMNDNEIAISPDIIPVYIAVTDSSERCKKEYFNEKNVNYLKAHEPIGCRDKKTYNRLVELGVKAFVNGCMTITIPQRHSKIRKYYYFVDAPAELIKYVPKEYLTNSVCGSQQFYWDKKVNPYEIKEAVIEKYDEYFNNAKLVITSRLHVASPCIAAGIPVIFAKEQIDERLDWLSKYIPLYDRSQFDNIDWHPNALNIEDIKRVILENAKSMVVQACGNSGEVINYNKVHSIYEHVKVLDDCSYLSTVKNHFDSIFEQIKKNYKPYYSVWGANNACENLIRCISSEYPDMKLRKVIDKYKKGMLIGNDIISPEEYKYCNEEYLFVIPVGAYYDSRVIKEKQGIPDDSFVYCAQRYITEDLIMKNRD